MLVLSRKVGEKLVIGDNITVVINRVAGNRVTIGIEAPDSVRIVRGELRPSVEASRDRTEATASPRAGQFESRADATFVSVPRLAK
jgi:carbon storage regulator